MLWLFKSDYSDALFSRCHFLPAEIIALKIYKSDNFRYFLICHQPICAESLTIFCVSFDLLAEFRFYCRVVPLRASKFSFLIALMKIKEVLLKNC